MTIFSHQIGTVFESETRDGAKEIGRETLPGCVVTDAYDTTYENTDGRNCQIDISCSMKDDNLQGALDNNRSGVRIIRSRDETPIQVKPHRTIFMDGEENPVVSVRWHPDAEKHFFGEVCIGQKVTDAKLNQKLGQIENSIQFKGNDHEVTDVIGLAGLFLMSHSNRQKELNDISEKTLAAVSQNNEDGRLNFPCLNYMARSERLLIVCMELRDCPITHVFEDLHSEMAELTAELNYKMNTVCVLIDAICVLIDAILVLIGAIFVGIIFVIKGITELA